MAAYTFFHLLFLWSVPIKCLWDISGPVPLLNERMAFPEGQHPDFISPYDERWKIRSNPTFTFDEHDTGGYSLDLVLHDIESHLFPFVWVEQTYFNAWLAVTTFNAPPMLGFNGCGMTCNCSYVYGKYVDADFLGVVNGVKICEPDLCCPYNREMDRASQTDSIVFHQGLNADHVFGGCDIISQPAYCIWITGQWWNCYTFSPSPYERAALLPCSDNSFAWLTTCVIWLVSPPNYIAAEIEGKLFESNLTPIENLNYLAWSEWADFVCLPWSYFEKAPVGNAWCRSGCVSTSPSSTPVLFYALGICLVTFVLPSLSKY